MRSKCFSISRFVVIIFALALSGSVARSQTPDPSPTPTPPRHSLESDFFKNILQDQKAIWTLPFHLRRHDARWLAPIGFGTAALIATDRRTGDELAESTGQLRISRDVSRLGSTYSIAAVPAAFYVVGRATHNDRARETGVLAAEALVDSLIVSNVIKEITQRRRPDATRGRSDFFDGGSSFPSGHSINSWTLATIIANEYHDHRAVQVAAYGLASAISISRFTGERHYLSDILVGSAMGYGIGRYVYKTHHVKSSGSITQEQNCEKGRRWPSIVPEYDPRHRVYGVAMSWSF